ncbi:MAG TPA: SCO1664 family protein [Jiangellaceae bacterium]|nr:SCO1664 family protein [Jiangellaceae bacterium]
MPAALSDGDLTVQSRLISASNATLLCRVSGVDGAGALRCIYKPVAGERPLWDFTDGTLAAREVAAYLVSEAAGWQVVPPTILRDGPFGPGMCQVWIERDGTELVDVVARGAVPDGWVRVLDAVDEVGDHVSLVHADDLRLRTMALFDLVVNNADRKGGHVLVATDAKVWGVDHGVSFHVDPKLRTVLWGWSGQPFTAAEQDVLRRLRRRLRTDLGEGLSALLSSDEVAATAARVDGLLASGRFPIPVSGRVPIPWPPF